MNTSEVEDKHVSIGTLLAAVHTSESRVRQDIATLKHELVDSLQNLEGILHEQADHVNIHSSKTWAEHHTSLTMSFEQGGLSNSQTMVAGGSGSRRGTSLIARVNSLEKMVMKDVNSARGSWAGWPMDLVVREELQLPGAHGSHLGTLKRLADVHRYAALGSVISVNHSSFADEQRYSVLRPDARRRLCFDICSLFVLSFQVWYTPFALAWPGAVESFEGVVLWCSASFWMLDLFMNFITGYYTRDGEVELRWRQVCRHYIQNWFGFDLLCVIADMVNLVTDLLASNSYDNGTTARVLRVVKLQRFLRVLLLVRMLRISRVVNAYMESRVSASWRLMLRTSQIAALLVWFTHIAACFWWAIGKWAPTGTTGERWIDTVEAGPADRPLRMLDVTWVYQFATSYHWALAQITLGAHEISPVNTWERVLAIICNLFGLLFGSTLISILSMATLQYREVDSERYTKMHTLHDFLLQHQVQIRTRLRITRQVQERVKPRDRTLTEKDVPALEVLSHPLAKELRCQLFERHVKTHALLQVWEQQQAESIRHLCKEGLSFVVLPPEDELFSFSEHSKAAYVITQGQMKYSQDTNDGLVQEDRTSVVSPGDWLSEATWWCHWVHVGTAATQCATTLVLVPPQAILVAMSREAAVNSITVAYGLRYHAKVVEVQDVLTSDVEERPASFQSIIHQLPRDVHVLLGVASLQHLAARKETRPAFLRLEKQGWLRSLEAEVTQGRSLLMLGDDGTLQRRVSLLVLELVNDKGEVFVELAHGALDSKDEEAKEADSWTPSLRLPAEKQLPDEAPLQTLQRLLESRLAPVQDMVSGLIPTRRFEEQFEESEHFGIGTQYLKTTFSFEPAKSTLEVLETHSHVLNRGQMGGSRIGISASTMTLPTSASVTARKVLMDRFARLEKGYYLQGSTHRGAYAWVAKDEFDQARHLPLLKDGISNMLTKISNAMEMAVEHLSECSSSAGSAMDSEGQAIDKI